MASQISAALSNRQWDIVIDIVKKDRKKAAVWAAKPGALATGPLRIDANVHGLPVHEAINVGAPYEVIDALARAYPEGLIKKELVMKRLPLHLACIRQPIHQNVIVMLMKYYKDAITDADKIWRTPIHYLLDNQSSLTVDPKACSYLVTSMLQLKPNVSAAQDKKGYTPLHLACLHKHSTYAIHKLLELYPEGAICTTERGLTPEDCYLSTTREKHSQQDQKEVIDLLRQHKLGVEAQFRDPMDVSSRRYVV